MQFSMDISTSCFPYFFLLMCTIVSLLVHTMLQKKVQIQNFQPSEVSTINKIIVVAFIVNVVKKCPLGSGSVKVAKNCISTEYDDCMIS